MSIFKTSLVVILATATIFTFSPCKSTAMAAGIPNTASVSLMSATSSTKSVLTQLKAAVKPYPAGRERAKALLNFIEKRPGKISAKSSDTVYAYAMNELQKCLETKEMRDLDTLKYEQISTQLEVFEADGKNRVIQYSPNSKVFGNNNSGTYAFYVPKTISTRSFLCIYKGSTKRIEYLSPVSKTFFVLAGNDGSKYAYAEGLDISKSRATITSVLQNSTANRWKITSKDGHISFMGTNTHTYIKYFASYKTYSKLTVVSQSNHKKSIVLKLKANSKIFTI